MGTAKYSGHVIFQISNRLAGCLQLNKERSQFFAWRINEAVIACELMVSLSLAYGCNKGPESTTQAAREPRMTDSDLKDKVEARIKSDAELRDADLSVSADAEKNWVTLSGTVPTEGMRTRAVEMARAAHAGLTVDDKIDVKHKELTRAEYTPEMARTEVENARAHKETVGGGVDDAWIHRENSRETAHGQGHA
jgi:osmotically-inducible protein OsmY